MDIDEENKLLRDIAFSIYHKIKDAKPYEDTRYRMQWVLISDFLIEEIIGYCKPKIKRFGDPIKVEDTERAMRYRDALQRIADGDVDRESAVKFRTDGKYSKNDKCKHGLFMYEECGQCLSDFARDALKEGK